jgi:tetratricopeptide (TPR) repeat protein
MLRTADMLPRKLIVFKDTASISLLICALFVCVFLLPVSGLAAQDSPEVASLKQKAQNAFVKGEYDQAAAFDLEIAEKYPGCEARRYAVQMLGTLYEDNIVDLKKAIKWDREFLEKYTDSRQVPVYKEKLASLEKLLNQEQAFKVYQSIRFANEGDEVMVQKFEALLKEHPEFLLKDKVESDLGYAYSRMDKQKKSALAFQAIASQGDNKLSASDKTAYETADRYWKMRTTWAWVAWAVILMLWVVVLLMKPWKQLTWASTKKFLLWPALWLLVTGASMPLFYSMETTGYPIVIPATTVYIAIGLNLIVFFWLLLLLNGSLWQTRRRALRWLSPILALLMTSGVFYLFVVYQPNGPFIVDVCVVKYDYWRGEVREWTMQHRAQGQVATGQSGRSAELAK